MKKNAKITEAELAEKRRASAAASVAKRGRGRPRLVERNQRPITIKAWDYEVIRSAAFDKRVMMTSLLHEYAKLLVAENPKWKPSNWQE